MAETRFGFGVNLIVLNGSRNTKFKIQTIEIKATDKKYTINLDKHDFSLLLVVLLGIYIYLYPYLYSCINNSLLQC